MNKINLKLSEMWGKKRYILNILTTEIWFGGSLAGNIFRRWSMDRYMLICILDKKILEKHWVKQLLGNI